MFRRLRSPIQRAITYRHLHRRSISHGDSTAVYSFGDNSMGALGLPSPLYDAYEPTRLPLEPSHGFVSSIAAGHYHSLAVTSAGEVWSWGRNDEAQLGRSPPTSRDKWHEPRRVEGLESVRARAAFASGVVSAVVGEDGSLWVWGRSKRGQLCLGSEITEAIKPTKVNSLAGENIVKVAFGWGHALAMTEDGKLFGWGNAEDGGLGRIMLQVCSSSDTIAEEGMHIAWEPRELEELDGRRVSDMACGLDHSIVLCKNGMLLSCGRNTYGQLGRRGEEFEMLPVVLPLPAVSVTAGLGHCLVLGRESTEGGGIISWGWNESSQLGRRGESDIPGEVCTMEGEKVVGVSGGRVHSVAVSHEGEVWTWGSGRNGRLGLESTMDVPEPMQLESLEGQRVLQAVCGFDHTLLLVAVQ
ncbi:regulator of chromosome condensation (RCC1) family protein [Wolffia australiana]